MGMVLPPRRLLHGQFRCHHSDRDSKRLGRDVPDLEVGYDVHYPVYFLRDNAGAILLKSCPWVSEARFLAEELSRLVAAPLSEQSGEPLD